MSDPRHARAKELFLAVCEEPPERRSVWLDRHCSDEPELRREVESLLAFHQEGLAETGRERERPEAGESAPPGSHAPAAGPSIGPYRVLRRIGAGGMGEVFLAHDPRLDRRVAIKALPPELAGSAARRQRLEAEARALAALNHPNVAAIYGLEQEGDRSFLVLEYVEGKTLSDRLAEGALPPEDALAVCSQIASGLEAAHAAGVIHRDLKPANVVLTAGGDAKVLDFGLARWTGPDPGDAAAVPSDRYTPTAPGAILGTPAYLSPEQARGKPVGRTTDIWALGCVLYECLVGSAAFGGETMSDSIAKILEGEPDWSALPAELPPPVVRLLRRCLTKDPRRRLQHPGDARIVLDEALERPAAVPGDGDRGVREARAGRRPPVWATAAILLGTLLAGFAAARLWSPAVGDEPAASPSRRLSIRLPDDRPVALASSAPLGVGRNALALSPDATALVYVTESGGTTRLALRRLDAFDVELLPGTEGAFAPFFSPDGRWVAYFTDGLLRRVPLAGGSPLTVTEARNPYGGTWAEDGTIHVAEAEGRVLVSVTPDGERRQARQIRRATSPQALPGGGVLVGRPVGVIDPETGQRRFLVEGSFARYLPGGHLLFAVEGQLFAARFDPQKPAPLGPAALFPAEVRVEDIGDLQLAVAAGTIAYLPGRPDSPRTLVWADRAGRLEPATEEQRSYGHLALSPDGDRLAVAIDAPRRDVWVLELARRGFTRLSRGGDGGMPIWSSDGAEVYYCARGEGLDRAWVRRADGSGEARPLFDAEVTGCVSSVSPDGRWATLDTSGGSETGWDILVAPLDGSAEPRPLVATTDYEWGPAISPDGRWVAYTSDASGRYEVYVRAFPAPRPGVPDRRWQVSTDGGEEPVWSLDGRELTYRNGRRWMSVTVGGHGDGAAEPTFSPPVLRLEGDFANVPGFSYELAPDGRLLLLQPARREPATEIRIVEGGLEP